MNTISTKTEQLDAPIAVTHDWQRFYQHAREEVGGKAIGH